MKRSLLLLAGTLCFFLFSNSQVVLPPSVSGLQLWLRADSGIAASPVAQWNDLSGNGSQAVQGTPANRPIVSPGIAVLNNKPTVRFDGTNDNLRIASFAQTQPLTVFVLWKTNGAAATQMVLDGVNSTNRLILRHTSSTVSIFGGANLAYSKTAPFDYIISELQFNGNTSLLYENGIQRAIGNAGTNTLTGLSIGARQDFATGNFLNGDIAEIIIYNRILNVAERQLIENYLRGKYVPTVSLGNDTTINYGFCPVTINAARPWFTSYQWSNGATGSSIAVVNPGTYAITATDLFGFQSSDTIVISRPAFDSLRFSPNTRTLCVGDSIVLNTGLLAAAYNFNWSNGASTPQVSIKTPGLYSVTVTDTSNCTLISDTVLVEVDSLSLLASLGDDTTICAGNRIGLQQGIAAGQSYLWNTGDTTAELMVTASGSYHIEVTSLSGCFFADTIQVNVSGAAPSVSFAFDTVCFGSPTMFTNLSSVIPPNNIDSVLWDFGGGQFSTLQNTTFLFPVHGLHPVTLTVYGTGGCFGSSTQPVTVYQNPKAGFVPDTVCAGLSVVYQDTSLPGSGQNISGWFWDFAGQATSANQTPIHAFSAPGNYSVTLTVTNDQACADTATLVVTAVPPNSAQPGPFSLVSPVQGFSSATPTVQFLWQPSLNALFYNVEVSIDTSFQTLIIDTITNVTGLLMSVPFSTQKYFWRVIAFNRCDESYESDVRQFSVFSPSFLGNQFLWLSADSGVMGTPVNSWNDRSGNNNHATNIGAVTIRPVLTGSIPLLNNKPTIRFDGNDYLRITSFTQAQPITAFIIWNVNGISPSTTYHAFDGTNSANRLILRHSGGAVAMFGGTTLQDVVPKAVPFNYVISSLYFNGDTSALYENGQRRSTGPGGSNSLSGLTLGGRQDLLANTFLNGDVAELILYNRVLTELEREQVEAYLFSKYTPKVNLGPDVIQSYELCPVTLDAGNRFISYLWSDSSSLPQLEVRKSGTYWVRVVDVFGRISSDTVNVVFPYRGMNVHDTVVCVGNTVNIAPQFSSSGYTFSWSNSSQDSSLSVSVSGDYYVVVSDSSGCSFTSDTVHVLVDSFSFFNLLPTDTVICSGNEIALATYQYPVISYLWNTGNDTAVQVVSSSGIYTVTALDVYNCLSSDTISVATSWVAPQADFSSTNVCLGNTITFGDLSIPVSPDNIRSWQWRFGDGDSAFVQNPAHLFGSIGDYSVQLFLVTDSGCTGILNRMVSVYPYPTASYSYPPIICAGTTVQFVDNSSVLSVTPITSWNWIFDNTDSSTLKNPVYSFTRQGEIPIKFYVSTNQGCVDSLYDTIEVFAPLIADFSFTKSCLGDSSRFTDITNSLSVVKWLWNFGDASFFSSQENPSHLYRFSGDYDVLLTVENAIGCIDTVTKFVTVVDTPSASFLTETACENALYLPIENSISLTEPIQRWDWWIGDSLYQNTVSPQHYFGSPGTYPVKLLVTTASGCVDSIIKSVSVFAGPRADFVFAPLYGEAPLEVNFTNQSSNAVSYSWNFGDGSGSFDLNPSYVYAQNGIYQIFLSVASAEGCVDSLTKQITIIPTDLDLWVDNITLTPIQSGGNEWITIQVRLINSGTRIITSATLYAIPGTGGVIAEEWTGTLLAGQFTYFTFSSQLVIDSRVADTYVCAEAASVNGGEREVNTDNNRMCASITENIQIAGPYPNPVTERSVLGVIMPRAGQVRVQITDLLGRKLLTNKQYDLPEGRSDIEIPSTQLRAGEYYLQIYYGEEKFTRKFTVLK